MTAKSLQLLYRPPAHPFVPASVSIIRSQFTGAY